MEQFNKWLASLHCKKQLTYADTWKAALRCVRDEMLPNCYEPLDIYDFIEEELGDG